jgi:putative glutamine amidotransferase
MTCVVVSSRVVPDPVHGTRSDSVDQRWWPLLADCGVVAAPAPNHPETALRLLNRLRPGGLLLTGGNDLAELGGDAPERDRTELALLDVALRTGLPVVAVCRGMQLLLRRFRVPLVRVTGHVAARQTVLVDGRERTVNSYHRWAAHTTRAPLRAWAHTPDGVVKAVRHETKPVLGMMWHPERLPRDLAREDVALLRSHFGVDR